MNHFHGGEIWSQPLHVSLPSLLFRTGIEENSVLLVAFSGSLYDRLNTKPYSKSPMAEYRLTTRIDKPCAAQQTSSSLNSLQASPRSVNVCFEPMAIDPRFPEIWTVPGAGGESGSSSLSMITMASRESTSSRFMGISIESSLDW